MHTSKLHNFKVKYQNVHTSKVHSVKEFNKKLHFSSIFRQNSKLHIVKYYITQVCICTVWTVNEVLIRSTPFYWVDPYPQLKSKGMDRLKTSLTVHTAVCMYDSCKISVTVASFAELVGNDMFLFFRKVVFHCPGFIIYANARAGLL